MSKHRSEDRHDSGQTSDSPKSGHGGRHDASGTEPHHPVRTDAAKLLGHDRPQPGTSK